MPSIPSRELSITYGSLTVNPDGAITFGETFDAETVEFEFNVTGADESAFAAACSAAEAAFRRPFQDLVITQGSATLKSLKHSTGTGLEIMPTISKADHVADTGRSRHYRVSIRCGRPANNVSVQGIREWSVSIAKDPAGRRLASLSGVWTANGSTNARDSYEAGIDNRAQLILAEFGGTWELIGEDPTAGSYNELTLAFTRRYHEVAFGQVGSANHQSIVEQQLRVSVRRHSEMQGFGHPSAPGGYANQGGGGGQAFPLIEVSGSYSCWVLFSAANGVAALRSIYQTIRPFLISQMQAAAGGMSFALTEERPEFEPDSNRITVTLAGVALNSGVIRREWSYQEATDTGIVLVPVWGDSAYSYFEYQGPAVRRATVTIMEESAGGGGGSTGGSSGGGGSPAIAQGFNFGFGDLFGNPFGVFVGTDNTVSSQPGSGANPIGGGSTPGVVPPTKPGEAAGSDSSGSAPSLGGGDRNWRVIHRPDVTSSQYAIGLENPIIVTRKTQRAVYQYIEPATTGKGAPKTAGSATTPSTPGEQAPSTREPFDPRQV